MPPLFGRRYAPDVRDANYPMRLQLGRPATLPVAKEWPLARPALDQGRTGTCVAHGWVNFLRAEPHATTPGFTPYQLYREIVALDEWTSNDREARNPPTPDSGLQFGTSVRAGAKALEARGMIESYVWAQDLATCVEWLLTQGEICAAVEKPLASRAIADGAALTE